MCTGKLHRDGWRTQPESHEDKYHLQASTECDIFMERQLQQRFNWLRYNTVARMTRFYAEATGALGEEAHSFVPRSQILFAALKCEPGALEDVLTKCIDMTIREQEHARYGASASVAPGHAGNGTVSLPRMGSVAIKSEVGMQVNIALR